MVGTQRDSGLSEVVGFILIIAILVIVASLYVTYVVPAQGREAEIGHMTYIKNQFVDFKMALDSLWISSLVNTSLSQNFEMGTIGQKTEGQFSVLPLAQPVGSRGNLTVITSPDAGTITINLSGFVRSTTPGDPDPQLMINPDIYTQLVSYQAMYPTEITNMIRIPVSGSGAPVNPNDFTTNQQLSFNLLTVYPKTTGDPSAANWTATFNLTRVPSFYLPNVAVAPDPDSNATKFLVNNGAGLMRANYRYDLIMSLMKRNQSVGYPVFQNFTLNSSSMLPDDRNLWVNLQDPAYGLDAKGPLVAKNSTAFLYYGYENITTNWDLNATNSLNVTIPVNKSALENLIKSSYTFTDVYSRETPMGKFSYTGMNNYWVPQEYYYQMGGVFLNQNGTVPKLLPLITLGMATNTTGDKIPSISVTKFVISQLNSSVSGSTSVQISSSISKIWRDTIQDKNGNAQYIAPVSDNARNITISIGPPTLSKESRQVWADSFNATIRSANQTSGFNTYWVTVKNESDGVFFRMCDPDQPGLNACPPSISVDYSEVNATVVLQPIGWV